MSLSENQKLLIGTWHLQSHGFLKSTGDFLPTGNNPRGQILYHADGSMSVFIAKVFSPEKLTDLIAYAGRYSIHDDVIQHHIDYAISKNREGTTENRLYSLEKNLLTLKTEKDDNGQFVIEWKRAL